MGSFLRGHRFRTIFRMALQAVTTALYWHTVWSLGQFLASEAYGQLRATVGNSRRHGRRPLKALLWNKCLRALWECLLYGDLSPVPFGFAAGVPTTQGGPVCKKQHKWTQVQCVSRLCFLQNTTRIQTMLWVLRGAIAVYCIWMEHDPDYQIRFRNLNTGPGPDLIYTAMASPLFMSSFCQYFYVLSTVRGGCHQCNVVPESRSSVDTVLILPAETVCAGSGAEVPESNQVKVDHVPSEVKANDS